MTGTLINTAAVILGGTIGLLLNNKLPDRFVKIVFQGLGLFTIFIGLSMAFKTNNFLLLVFSLVLGGTIGELLNIERFTDRFGEFLKGKVRIKDEYFSEGLVTSFLLFCVGSMTILGAIEEGLGGKPNLLLIKSLMDGFSSIILASAFGFGVIVSAIPLLIYQGGLTLISSVLEPYLSDTIINELTSTGGLLLLGIGITMLEIKKIRVINMLPSLVIIIILVLIFK